MTSLDPRADLLDPGDTVSPIDMEVNDHELTASQMRQFEESNFDDIGPIDTSHQHDVAGGRKRKGSSSAENSGDIGSKRHVPDSEAPVIPRRSPVVAGVDTAAPTAQQGGPVVLIRPVATSIKMLTSPEQLCAALEAAPFDTMSITDVRVNGRKGLVAIELAPDSAASVAELLKLTVVGPWTVQCSLPNSEKYSYGVINSIDVDADLAAMSGRVHVAGGAKFVRLERLSRSVEGRRVPSTSLRIVFEGADLPRSVKIGYISYPVRKYEFPPLQCYKCQRFGHSAEGCNSKVRCLVCSGPHKVSDCQNGEIRCANCGGPHKANSRDCGRAPKRAEPKHPEGFRVSTVRTRGGGSQVPHSSRSGSHVDAPWSSHHGRGSGQGAHSRELSAHANNCCVCRPVVVSPVRSSYSSAVVGSDAVAPRCDFPGFSPVVSSDSVRLPVSADVVPAASSAFSDSAFFSRLTACLTDLFSLSLHVESAAKTQSLISSAIQRHFNVTLPDSSCASVVAASIPVSPEGQPSCSSPATDAVCSPGEDLVSRLGVSDFQLVSDSDISLEMAGSVGEVVDPSEVRHNGHVSGALEPTPSPVIGPIRGGRAGRPKKLPSVESRPSRASRSSSSAIGSSTSQGTNRISASSKSKK